MSNSSQEPSATGKPEMKNRETNSRVLFSNTLTCQLWEEVFLRDLLSQARSELMRQEHKVGSLNNRICELQQQACAQRLELQDAQLGYI